MFAARAIQKLATRNMGHFTGPVVSGPPRNRVSAMEKAVLGSTMILCFLAPPTWVLINLQKYKGEQ